MKAHSGFAEGRLLLDGRLVPGRIEWVSGRITLIEPATSAGGAGNAGASGDAAPGLEAGSASGPEAGPNARSDAGLHSGSVIAPGLIDLHVHGYGGHDPIEQLAALARALASMGTTAFQPTLFPAAPAVLGSLAERVMAAASSLHGGARVLGLHLEGPFVNRASAGALSLDDLAEPSLSALRELLGPATGSGRGIRTVTLAPELPGALELIEELTRCGIRTSLGHSLATADEARAAARAGATGATHLYNAMRPFHHREAGLVGFALSAEALSAELIGDLVHVGRDAIDLALAARGARSICLISDALRGAGTGCERFHSHGREHVERGGAYYYPSEPPRLAGSARGQLEQVRLLVAAGVLSLEEALVMAAEAPARALGIERDSGRLVVGARADLIQLGASGLPLERVWIDGAPQGLAM
jgi:N-acetylglucosamine-6-phosphate deacetylase